MYDDDDDDDDVCMMMYVCINSTSIDDVCTVVQTKMIANIL